MASLVVSGDGRRRRAPPVLRRGRSPSPLQEVARLLWRAARVGWWSALALLATAWLWEVGSPLVRAWQAGVLGEALGLVASAFGRALLVTSPPLVVVVVALLAGGALGKRPMRRRRPRRLPEAEADPRPALGRLEPRGDDWTPDCPVCGDALGQEVRRCPRCDAPHHPECWDYQGRCAIYGCG